MLEIVQSADSAVGMFEVTRAVRGDLSGASCTRAVQHSSEVATCAAMDNSGNGPI